MFDHAMPFQLSSRRPLISLLVLAFATLSLGGMTGQVAAQDKATVSPAVGSWKWMRDVDDKRVRCNVHISEKDGELAATFDDKKKTVAKVTKVKFDDGELNIVLELEDESEAKFKGKLKGNRVQGKAKWGDGEVVDWKAVRFTSLADASATWNLSFTTPDGVTREPQITLTEKDGEAVLKFEENSDGEDESSDGEISNVKFEDGVLTFDVALEFNGSDLKLEYDLEIKGDEIDGSMFFEIAGGPSGDIEVEGERAK